MNCKLRRLFWRLHSPDLVVRFQRLCGIIGEFRDDKLLIRIADSAEIETDKDVDNNDLKASARYKTVLTEQIPTDSLNNSTDSTHSKSRIVTRNQLLFLLFSLSSALGSEPFYITFYSFVYWNIDTLICRRMVYFWSIYMFIGQAAKDWIRIPRPKSPPVVVFDKWHALEYGFPSTHSMVGFGIPVTGFYMVATMYQLTQFQLCLGVITCLFWILLVAVSRIYLGMHSVADVLGGTLLMLFLTPVYLLYVMEPLDRLVMTSLAAPLYLVGTTVFLVTLCYPSSTTWSPTRGETALILAAGTGLSSGAWACARAGYLLPPVTSLLTTRPVLTLLRRPSMAEPLARFVVGAASAAVVRIVAKSVTYRVICHVTGNQHGDMRALELASVELPLRYVTYFLVGFNSGFTAVWLFDVLGIKGPLFSV